MLVSGADLGGGFDHLPTQRVPLWYFLRNPLLVTDPIIFLKALLAPIYNNFEGERAPKKTQFFLVKIFQKVSENGFFDLFFQKVACGAENLAKTASF